MDKLVSAIITTYNREPGVIANAIESILNQSYKPIELIIVDDNENDSEKSNELKEFLNRCYPQIIYIKQDGNKGACAARNLGLKYARGEFVGYLDDDDEWLPNKIQLQMDAFSKGGGDLALVYGKGQLINYNTNPPTVTVYNDNKIRQDLNFYELLNEDKVGSTSMPLIRKTILENVGGFCETLPARQDYELWLRIAQRYRISGINDKLFIYNVYKGEQISSSPGKAYNGFKYIYKKFKYEYDNNLNLKLSIFSRMYHTAKKAKSNGTIIIGIRYGVIRLLQSFYRKA